MEYWIDKDSENKNITVITEQSVFIGSCDKEHQERINQQLKNATHPAEVLGTDDVLIIPLTKVQSAICRSTDDTVDIRYKTQKDIEEETVYFDNSEEKTIFVKAFDKYLPDTIERKQYQQSSLVAAIYPLLSVLFFAFVFYLFYYKFMWLTIIVGGLGLLMSLYMLMHRLTKPPMIIRWNIKGKYVRKTWQGIKTGFSFLVVLGIMYGVSSNFSDNSGPKSIYEHVVNDEQVSDKMIKTYLDRGGDINYQDEDGDTALHMAMDWDMEKTAIALIENGADLSIANAYGETPLEAAIRNDYNVAVIEHMIQKGASLDFTLSDMKPLDYAVENEMTDVAELLRKYQ